MEFVSFISGSLRKITMMKYISFLIHEWSGSLFHIVSSKVVFQKSYEVLGSSNDHFVGKRHKVHKVDFDRDIQAYWY